MADGSDRESLSDVATVAEPESTHGQRRSRPHDSKIFARIHGHHARGDLDARLDLGAEGDLAIVGNDVVIGDHEPAVHQESAARRTGFMDRNHPSANRLPTHWSTERVRG